MTEPPNYNIVIKTSWNNEFVPDDLFRNKIFAFLAFRNSHQFSVNLKLIQFSSKVCYYKMVALSAYEMLSFPSVKPLPSLYKDQSTITVSLPPNKHFNLTITAYNGYGNTITTVDISKSVLKKTLLHI